MKKQNDGYSGQGDVIDYNIQPPGYSSVEMMRYSIEELNCYKVIMDEAAQ